MTLAMRLTFLCAVAALSACGGGGGDGAVDAAPDPTGVEIAVTIEYDGDLVGDLTVGAFHSNPPLGGPLAFRTLAAPEFPVDATLTGLAPDTYYVIAVLDLAPASPTVPGPEDLQVASGPHVVEPGDQLDLRLTITEPTE